MFHSRHYLSLFVLAMLAFAAAADTPILRDGWYLSRPDEHAAIQLSGHRTEQAAAGYIRRNGITGTVGYFSTHHNDEPWFSVTYGEYENLDEARRGMASLPDNLRTQSPWPRTFAAIKNLVQTPSAETATAPPPADAAPDNRSAPATTDTETIRQTSKNKQPIDHAIDMPANDWFLARKPDYLTIQLYGSWEEGDALQFIETHGIEDMSHVMRASRSGRPWYSVTYGEYSSMPEAKKANTGLAGRLGIAGTWVRPFSSIQQAIRQAEQPVNPAPVRVTGPQPGTSPASTEVSSEDRDQLRKAQALFVRGKYMDAFAIWMPLAERGIAEAQYSLGFLYHSGWGPQRDLGKAVKWYTLAGEQQESRAQFNLGVLLIESETDDVPIDYKNGIMWIKQSANNGNTRARELLAEAYEKGLYGLPQSSVEAQYWKTQ